MDLNSALSSYVSTKPDSSMSHAENANCKCDAKRLITILYISYELVKCSQPINTVNHNLTQSEIVATEHGSQFILTKRQPICGPYERALYGDYCEYIGENKPCYNGSLLHICWHHRYLILSYSYIWILNVYISILRMKSAWLHTRV